MRASFFHFRLPAFIYNGKLGRLTGKERSCTWALLKRWLDRFKKVLGLPLIKRLLMPLLLSMDAAFERLLSGSQRKARAFNFLVLRSHYHAVACPVLSP